MTSPYVANNHLAHLTPRLEDFNKTDNSQLKGVSEYHLNILQWVSMCLAGVSLAATLLALYWFVRMRRNFRHDLILLLIQGDLLKSLWLVLFPIVDFSGADTQDGSVFCETSGFFLATGIEACDIAVLLISLHTAIYVFGPRRGRSIEQNGLAPYRRLVYAAYAGFPLLMASLAFVQGPTGYRNVGDACYLDATDDWHRMYLSWVPRYIIFGIIFILHISMYIYVRTRLGHFSRKGSSAHSVLNRALPPTPPLECHGLIPPSAPDSRRSTIAGSMSRRFRVGKRLRFSMAVPSQDRISSSPATLGPETPDQAVPGGKELSAKAEASADSDIQRPQPVFDCAPKQPSMHRFRFPQAPALNRIRSESRLGPYEMSTSSLVPDPVDDQPPTSHRHDSNASQFPLISRSSNDSFYRRPIVCLGEEPGNLRTNSRPDPDVEDHSTKPDGLLQPESRHISPSLLNLLAILRRGPSSQSTSPPPHSLHFSPETASSGLISSRLHTRRQLRMLFVYPLAYLLTWALPFISHLLRYDDHSRAGGDHPFWLLLASLAAVSLQGTVDSVIFMLQVRPWRYVKRDVGFWRSLGERLHIRWRWRVDSTGGRTGEEMREGERAARVRRDVEAAQEASEREERERGRSVVVVVKPPVEDRKERRTLHGERNWWDVELDGIFEDEGDVSESEVEGLQRSDKALDVEKGHGR